ncbi:MAG TPA: hypothetical protein EYH58_06530 [Aquifex aeolicus]|nr:hypothetical protein [Aquifex aeolicus]
MKNKELQRLIIASELMYPKNVFTKEFQEELEKINLKELEENLPQKQFEKVKKYLEEEVVLPFPDIEGKVFSTFALAKKLSPIAKEFKKLLEEEVEFANKVYMLIAPYRVSPKISEIHQGVVWRLLTLTYSSARSFTTLLIILLLVFLIDKGVIGKISKDVAKKWKEYWMKYGNYLITGKSDTKDLEKIYEELKPYIEKAYSRIQSLES